MREAVSEILSERARMTDGMSRMVVLSLAGHALLGASLVVAPDFWRGDPPPEAAPMMISLGGAPGPDSGGLNTISNRAIQREAAPEEKPAPAPPAAKAPEMVAPEPLAKPAPKAPAKEIAKPKEPTSARKPSSGAAVAPGAARVDVPDAPQVPFGGLTTGGGGTSGARTDVTNFCCPAYLAGVVAQIKRNWSERQSVAGQSTIKFIIQRDGTLTDVAVDKSGGQLLDIASQRALSVTKKVDPLPREFTNNTLTVYLIFEYSR